MHPSQNPAENREFPDSSSTRTMISKEFSSADAVPSAPGSALHRSSCESHLVLLEFTYTLSQIFSITPSCSRQCLEFRNEAMDNETCF